MPQEEAAEGPDNNEQVGDRLYEGSSGHVCCERLMDKLFDNLIYYIYSSCIIVVLYFNLLGFTLKPDPHLSFTT
jgi:hypothetical protein